jgi:ketosteroid isomerase-like protein
MTSEANKAKAVAFIMDFAATGKVDPFTVVEDASWWTASTGEVPIAHHIERSRRTSERLFAGPGRFEIHSVTADDDRVAIEANGFQALRDGTSYDNVYLWLFRFQDGKISSVRTYLDTALAERTFQPNNG